MINNITKQINPSAPIAIKLARSHLLGVDYRESQDNVRKGKTSMS